MQPGRRSILKGGLAAVLGFFGLGSAAKAQPFSTRADKLDPKWAKPPGPEDTYRVFPDKLWYPEEYTFDQLLEQPRRDNKGVGGYHIWAPHVMPFRLGDHIYVRGQWFRVWHTAVYALGFPETKPVYEANLLLEEAIHEHIWATNLNPAYWQVDDVHKCVYASPKPPAALVEFYAYEQVGCAMIGPGVDRAAFHGDFS